MTPRERYFAVLDGRRPDYAPRIPILMQFAAEYIGSNYGAFAADHRILVEANLRCAADFGMDQVSAISDPYRETSAFGGAIEFQRDGVPLCQHPPLEEDPSLDRLPWPDPMVSVRTRDRIDAIAAYRRQTGDRYSILGWIEGPAAEAADLRGVSNFLMDLLDDAPYARALMERCVEFGLEFGRAQVEAGADTIGIGDAVASQMSAAIYTELVLPYERMLVEGVKRMGARVRLHICGNITHLLPGIATLPVDIVDADYMVDLSHARRVLGPAKVIAGNVNPVACVMKGTPDDVRAAVRRCRMEADGGPYMVNAGCEIPAATPHANLLALCEPLFVE